MPKRALPILVTCSLTLCLCAATLHAQDLDNLQFHGFASQGFVYTTNNNYLSMQTSDGSLRWTDGGLSVTDTLSDKLRVGIQLHMYQLGQMGGANVAIDWASGDYKVNDFLGFRAGKVKTARGLFNDSQDIDAGFLWVLLPQSMYSLDSRSFMLSHLGGEVYGRFPVGKDEGTLQYRAFAGYASYDSNSGYAMEVAQMGMVFSDNPGGKLYGGDLRWVAKGFTLGSSARVQSIDATANIGTIQTTPFVMSDFYAQYQKGKYYFAGEYGKSPVHEQFNVETQAGPMTIPLAFDTRNWYVMGSYRVTRKLQVGSYYSYYENKAGDTSLPANYAKDWVVSGRWDFNSYFYAKLEEHFLHGTGLGYYEATNPNGLHPKTAMLAAKIGFSF